MECNFKPCASNQFRCRSGECIERSKVCNALVDCRDRDDELGCEHFACDPLTEFKCDSGQCIDLRKRNDFFIDCPDASDERDTGEFRNMPACSSLAGTSECEDREFQHKISDCSQRAGRKWRRSNEEIIEQWFVHKLSCRQRLVDRLDCGENAF